MYTDFGAMDVLMSSGSRLQL